MSKGQYAQIETAFILNDQRLDDMSGNTFRLYITLWSYAVNQRTDTFRFDNVGRSLARLSRNDSRTIHFSLTTLQQLCLIEQLDKNTIRVCGVKNKHPKLKWKNVTQTKVTGTVREPNRIEKNRIEKKSKEKNLGELEFPEKKPKKQKIPYREIIEYLNQKTGRNFNHTTKSFQNSIRARWVEHPNIEDFKKVVDNKCADPYFRERSNLLNPLTLFSRKFDKYLYEEPEGNELSKTLISTGEKDYGPTGITKLS